MKIISTLFRLRKSYHAKNNKVFNFRMWRSNTNVLAVESFHRTAAEDPSH